MVIVSDSSHSNQPSFAKVLIAKGITNMSPRNNACPTDSPRIRHTHQPANTTPQAIPFHCGLEIASPTQMKSKATKNRMVANHTRNVLGAPFQFERTKAMHSPRSTQTAYKVRSGDENQFFQESSPTYNAKYASAIATASSNQLNEFVLVDFFVSDSGAKFEVETVSELFIRP